MPSTVEKDTRLTPPRWVITMTALVALIILLYLIRGVLPPFLIGAIGAYVFGPVVVSIQDRWRLPRWAAVLLFYLVAWAPIVVVLVVLGPRLVVETRLFIIRFPVIVARLVEQSLGAGPYSGFGAATDSNQVATAIIDAIRNALDTPSTALRLVTGVADFGLNFFLSLVVSIYLLADTSRVENALLGVVPRHSRSVVRTVSFEIHETLARFLRRELFLVVLVSAATFLGLDFILHLRYAVPLALMTGLVEIIPFIGPVLAGTIGATVGLSQGGPGLMVGVIIFYIILRQVEDQIVAPVVLGQAVELHPLIVIFAVLAGGSLFGVLGTLGAIPFAASIKVILDYWPRLTAFPPPTIDPAAADPPVLS